MEPVSEAVLCSWKATMKDLMAEERGGRLLQPSFPRWNSPQLLSSVVAGAVVDGLAGKKSRLEAGGFMETVLQTGPSMKDLTVEENGGRFLPPSPSRRRNPPPAMPQLFTGGAVDVGGYDHAAFLVDSLAANKPLPEKGRFLEGVVQAGPLMKDLMVADRTDDFFSHPWPGGGTFLRRCRSFSLAAPSMLATTTPPLWPIASLRRSLCREKAGTWRRCCKQGRR